MEVVSAVSMCQASEARPRRTRAEARSSTPSTAAPEVAVEDTRTSELKGQVKRLLKLVVDAGRLLTSRECLGERGVRVIRVEETGAGGRVSELLEMERDREKEWLQPTLEDRGTAR